MNGIEWCVSAAPRPQGEAIAPDRRENRLPTVDRQHLRAERRGLRRGRIGSSRDDSELVHRHRTHRQGARHPQDSEHGFTLWVRRGARFEGDESWTSWERHPAGDEALVHAVVDVSGLRQNVDIHIRDGVIAGHSFGVPSVEVLTIGAGGGSIDHAHFGGRLSDFRVSLTEAHHQRAFREPFGRLLLRMTEHFQAAIGDQRRRRQARALVGRRRRDRCANVTWARGRCRGRPEG